MDPVGGRTTNVAPDPPHDAPPDPRWVGGRAPTAAGTADDWAGPLRLLACVRATPVAVWLLTGLFGLVIASYALALPVYHGPDEDRHVDMLIKVAEGDIPLEPGTPVSEEVSESTRVTGYQPGRGARSPEEVVPRQDRRSFDTLAADPEQEPQQSNQMWQHPPLAYVLTTGVLTLTPALDSGADAWASDQAVSAGRMVGALLVMPLPLFAFWATRRLAGTSPPALAAAVMAGAVPGVAHIAGTVTNDSLLIALLGFLTVPLAFVGTGDLSLRTAVLTGVAGGLALLTKGFALIVVAWMGAAYLLGLWRGRRATLGPAAGSGALALGIAGLLGGWWWLRNIAVHGTLQPRAQRGEVPNDLSDLSVFHWLEEVWDITPPTFLGAFGWLEGHLAGGARWSAGLVLLTGIVLAFVLRRRSDPWRRADLVLALGAVAGTAAIMLIGSLDHYYATGGRIGLHGRYLMGGMVGMAAVAGIGLATALRPVARWVPAVLLVAGTTLHGFGLSTMLDRFYIPEGADARDGLMSLITWSPWSLRVLVVVAVLVVVLALGALVALVVSGARRPLTAGGAADDGERQHPPTGSPS